MNRRLALRLMVSLPTAGVAASRGDADGRNTDPVYVQGSAATTTARASRPTSAT